MSIDLTSRRRRMLYTPVFDLLRGRVTGSTDIRYELADAGLPKEVVAFAGDVMGRISFAGKRRTNIKRTVANHFYCGISAGRDPQELIRSFGDPKRVAGLLNWAMFHTYRVSVAILYAQLAGIALLVAVYLLTLLFTFNDEPDVTTNYVTQINAPAAAVPEVERAWPVYREIFEQYRPDYAYQGWSDQLIDDGLYINRSPRPGKPYRERWVAWRDSHLAMIDKIRDASTMPGMGYHAAFDWGMDPEEWRLFSASDGNIQQPTRPARVLDAPYEVGLMSMRLTHLGVTRNFASWLVLDMDVAAEREEAKRVLEDYLAVIHMAEQVYELRLQPCRGVASGLIVLANTELAYILEEQPGLFTDEQLRILLNAALIGDTCIDRTPQAEWAAVQDAIQHYYSGKGRMTLTGVRLLTDDSENPEWANQLGGCFGLPIAYWLYPTRDTLEQLIDRLKPAYTQLETEPLWRLKRGDTAYERILGEMFASPIQHVRYFHILNFCPTGPSLQTIVRQIQMHVAVLRIAIALELHRREHGEYPSSLNALVPRWLAAVPVDASTGDPLIFHVDEQDRIVIYGRGLDGDDDGGTPGVDYRGDPMLGPPDNVPIKGDWLLWPLVIDPITTEAPELDEWGEYAY